MCKRLCLLGEDLVQLPCPHRWLGQHGQHPRQIWIGGRVGITPFAAGLKALPDEDRPATIDLFYTTKVADPAFASGIRELATQKGVHFHLLEEKDGLLTLNSIEALVPDWEEAGIWFCGPSGFGDSRLTSALGEQNRH
jgi:predicted ferric reductase